LLSDKSATSLAGCVVDAVSSSSLAVWANDLGCKTAHENQIKARANADFGFIENPSMSDQAV